MIATAQQGIAPRCSSLPGNNSNTTPHSPAPARQQLEHNPALARPSPTTSRTSHRDSLLNPQVRWVFTSMTLPQRPTCCHRPYMTCPTCRQQRIGHSPTCCHRSCMSCPTCRHSARGSPSRISTAASGTATRGTAARETARPERRRDQERHAGSTAPGHPAWTARRGRPRGGGTEVLVAPCRRHHEGLTQRASPSQHPINTVRVFDTLPLRCSDRPQFRAPLHLMS